MHVCCMCQELSKTGDRHANVVALLECKVRASLIRCLLLVFKLSICSHLQVCSRV